MGSEIVFLFGPLCLAIILALGYLASKPQFRAAAILCIALSAVVSFVTVDVVASYSFWTQAGFYGFVFIAASFVTFPLLLGLRKLLKRRPPTSGGFS